MGPGRFDPLRAWLAVLLVVPLGGCILVRPPDIAVIDPYSYVPPPSYGRAPVNCPVQGAWMGAVQGAAGGALVGSLWGDAGRGAAAGAAVGAVAGAVAASEACPP